MVRVCGSAGAALLVALPLHALPTIPLLRPLEPAPNGIVASPEGVVYFVDTLHRTVWRLLPDGTAAPFVTGTSGSSLQIDAEGNIYGTHTEARGRVIIWRADPHGHVTEVGRARTPAEARRLMAAGWGGAGRTGHAIAGEIDGMTRTRSGDLIITAGPAVQRIGRDGRITTIAAGGDLLAHRTNFLARLFGGGVAHLIGVAATASGDIYVANAARGAVIRLEKGGGMHEVYVSEPGWRTAGVAACATSIYVLEYGVGARVRRLDASGGSRIVAVVPSPRAAAAATLTAPWLPI